MISDNQILKALRSKKSYKTCAKKLGISTEEFIKRKNMLNSKDFEKDYYIAALEEKVVEVSENLKDGSARIKAVSLSEPHSAEDIEKLIKIDKAKWKLATYWNKQHKDSKGQDYWVVSAMVTKVNETEMSIDDAEQILNKVFAKTTPMEKVKVERASNRKALFVYTSDKHVAAYVDDKEAMYKNTYDRPTFISRLLMVLSEIQYLHSVYGTFDQIFVVDLGDRMDGMNAQTTRGGHKLPQNMSDKEAFEAALVGEKHFYDILFNSGYAENYTVIANACSNHGGIFDYMVARALEIYIKAAYPHVRTHIQEKFLDHVHYGKHVFVFTHGKDTADLKHGLPFHLNDKTENYLNKYLMYNKIDPESKTISIIKGDLHRDASETTYGFRYRNVLSLFGGSKWVGNNFGPVRPGCSFDVVEETTDRIYEHKLLF